MARSILWFRQDLRLHDNESLTEAIRNSDELLPVYVIHFRKNRVSPSRKKFLFESLRDLRQSLRSLGSDLLVMQGRPDEVIYQLALDTQTQYVYCNRERTREEVDEQDSLEKKLWSIGRELRYGRGKMLYYTADLPFPITHCPDSFAAFRKEVEQLIQVRVPLSTPDKLPPFYFEGDVGQIHESEKQDENADNPSVVFHGGEEAGKKALEASMKVIRPVKLGSTDGVLSPWISMGNLSPKTVYHTSFELSVDGESIREGLIYRDYLRLMGKKYGDRIFYKHGISGINLPVRTDSNAFRKWAHGETDIDIIDAAMHQLSITGWMPDVLRKLTALYFLKILHLDWRLGAAWFESHLIDYDPCSNWVSWLNLAGLGPEPNFDRTVNFDLAGKKLDPNGDYVRTWTRK